jgi:RNA polymerase sigma factor for flagellar operon FliA
MSREQLFLSQLALIERIVAWVCARRGLRGADAEDFASTVKLRFIENDYEVLGRFEGRSSLATYVTAVVHRLYLDFQAARFGKWRPSAEARRLGPVALRLESLLYRDGLTFDEAHGVLTSNHGVAESRETLFDLSLRLPRRVSRKHASTAERDVPSGGTAPSAAEQAERQVVADKTFGALRQALARLAARDRIVLRLHVEGGLSVADVARALGEDQKALYRKRDALFKGLRHDLEAQGVRSGDVQELLATLDWESALTDRGSSGADAGHGQEGGA